MRLKLNEDFCLGCKACVVACLDAHNLPFKALLDIEENCKETENGLSVSHRLHACLQCAEPHCLGACPEYAISRTEDGIVVIQEDRCNGCGRCAIACPTASIVMVKRMGKLKAMKCDLCGGSPRCVKACPYAALEARA